MLLKEAFNKIEQLDQDKRVTFLSYDGIDVWPILRQCLWKLLNSSSIENLPITHKNKPAVLNKIKFFLVNLKHLHLLGSNENKEVSYIFISNPVHLQRLKNNKKFDKIIDPLISLLDPQIGYEKFYVSSFQFYNKLCVAGKILFPFIQKKIKLSSFIEKEVVNIAQRTDLEPSSLLSEFRNALVIYYKWNVYGNRLFEMRPNLKRLFLVGWYSPSIMGLISAARNRGISCIDLQHGKQGRYQAMYNGWNESRINIGYNQMPDYFWVWGKPTRQHILDGTKRNKHVPVIGGYPWIEHYMKFEFGSEPKLIKKNKTIVLFTMQPPQGLNIEPIPNFILDLLESKKTNIFIIFRKHPNDKFGEQYYKKRVINIKKELHSFDDGTGNLFDIFGLVTHHITAYSSCCYEAKVFGIETLLFGKDALDLYKEEIKNSIFTWTTGTYDDAIKWIEGGKKKNMTKNSSEDYIISSLKKAQYLVNNQSIFP